MNSQDRIQTLKDKIEFLTNQITDLNQACQVLHIKNKKLEGMLANETWSVYLVRCADDSLYCGITTCVKKRVKTHNEGKGAKYTRSRRPVEEVVQVGHLTHSEALKLEYKVKQVPRLKKVKFLESFGRNERG